MEQIPASIWTLTAGVVVTLISFWVGHHHGLLPEQASEQAPLVDNFFDIMLTIGTALFLVVQGAIILFVIRYRRRPGDEGDGVPVEGNLPLEAFWTAIPALIVIFLGIYSVDIFQRMGGLNPGDHAMHSMHTLGIIVGLVNIQDKELQLYMISNIAFLVAANGFIGVLAALPVGTMGITFLTSFVHNIVLFVAPGVAVVALKALYEVSKD